MSTDTFDYVITLKKQQENLLHWMSELILFLAAVVFLFQFAMGIQMAYSTYSLLFWLILSLAVIAWGIYAHIQYKRKRIFYVRVALMLSAWGFFIIPGGRWLSIIYLLLTILEKPVKVPLEVAFDAEGLVFNTFPKRSIDWKDIQNVVLKDGLLTIDLKNNKLLQRETAEATLPFEEAEFNRFCSEQLNLVSK
ncbi:MAG: hypothetical protein ACOVQE_08960 [Chitinophagaceae bacterium]